MKDIVTRTIAASATREGRRAMILLVKEAEQELIKQKINNSLTYKAS